MQLQNSRLNLKNKSNDFFSLTLNFFIYEIVYFTVITFFLTLNMIQIFDFINIKHKNYSKNFFRELMFLYTIGQQEN